MKNDLTQEQIYEVIAKVAKNHRNKAFDSYTEDDIEQEVWIIALKIIEKFTPQRGKEKDVAKCLEHWLNRVMSNRLKNLYRDEHTVPSKSNQHNFCNPLSIDEILDLPMKAMSGDLIKKEYWCIIIQNLDYCSNQVLESILNGEIVPLYYRTKLQNKINKIIGEKCPEMVD